MMQELHRFIQYYPELNCCFEVFEAFPYISCLSATFFEGLSTSARLDGPVSKKHSRRADICVEILLDKCGNLSGKMWKFGWKFLVSIEEVYSIIFVPTAYIGIQL